MTPEANVILFIEKWRWFLRDMNVSDVFAAEARDLVATLEREVAEARGMAAQETVLRVKATQRAEEAEWLVVSMSKQCAEMERRLNEMERQRDALRPVVRAAILYGQSLGRHERGLFYKSVDALYVAWASWNSAT